LKNPLLLYTLKTCHIYIKYRVLSNYCIGGVITDEGKSGHRERLRKSFLSGNEGSHTDEALLELLLTYAIPQKDVRPLANQLISKFGSLQNVLSADVERWSSLFGQLEAVFK